MRAAVGDRTSSNRISFKMAVCLAGLVLAAGCGSAPGGGGGPSPSPSVSGQQPGGGSGSATASGGKAPGGQPGQGQGRGQVSAGAGSVRKQVRPASGGFEVSVGGPVLGAPGYFFSEAVEFGPQQVGTRSASKLFRVKLGTGYPARIDRIGAATAGAEGDVAQFPLSADDCSGLTLRPRGEACTAAVRFAPETSGAHTVYLVVSVTILCEDRDQFPCAPPDPNLPPENFPRQDVAPSGQMTVPHSEPLALLRGEGVDPAQTTAPTGPETPTSSQQSATSGSTGSTEAPPGGGTAPGPSAPPATF